MTALEKARYLIAGEAQLEKTANGESARYFSLCEAVGILCEVVGD